MVNSAGQGGDGTFVGTRRVQGEETWAYLPADNGHEAGVLYLRNDLSGSLIELDRSNSAGSFVYRENPWGSPTVCWLRDLCCDVFVRGFASQDAIHELELGEGERFPRTVAHQVGGQTSYVDKVLGGLRGWQITGRRGHVVLQGVWGAEVWLIADGFMVLSSICSRALFVRQGITCYASSDDARNYMAMDRLCIWLESHCGEAVAKSHLTDPVATIEREKQLQIDQDDADVARLKLWFPPVHDVTKRPQSAKPQTPSDMNLGWLSADWEPSSRPQTRYTTGSYSSRPMTRGSNINRWSAPSGRALAADLEANLATLERLARDGIISMEQYEACIASSQADDAYALNDNLKAFQGSHQIEHELNYSYSKKESTRRELEALETRWAVEMKDMHTGHDDLLLTLIREIRRIEAVVRDLGVNLSSVGSDVVDCDQDSEDSEDSGDDAVQKVLSEEEIKQEEKKMEGLRLTETLAHLQERIEIMVEEHNERVDAVILRQDNERKALEQQISHFGRKINSLKEAFREARDEEERLKLENLTEPSKKGAPTGKIIKRPLAIKENRTILNSTLPSTYPFEDDLNDEQRREQYALLRGDETLTMLCNTAAYVKSDEGLQRNGIDFIGQEFKELVGHTRPRVHVLEDEYDDMGETFGASSTGATATSSNTRLNTKGETARSTKSSVRKKQSSRTATLDPLSDELLLKKKLAVLQNVALTKSTRAATKPRSDQRSVLDFMMNEQDKQTVFRDKELRGVFIENGTEYLTEMPAALDWTLHVPLGHEREQSLQAIKDKHELQRYATSETIRIFQRMKEKKQWQEQTGDCVHEEDDQDEHEKNAVSDLVAKIQKQHQGSWTWASKSMRKARAAKEHRYSMTVTKGKIPDFKFKGDVDDEEGFDYRAAAKNVTTIINREVPGLSAVWTPSWELKEELWDCLSSLASPKRRGLWTLISEADGILPQKMRERSAAVLVYAYRIYLAKTKARKIRAVYQLRMYIRLQCNMRMAVARRVLPRKRIAMASFFEERERLRLEKIRLGRILKMTITETKTLSEEDKVYWMMHQPKPIEESMARRLLQVCDFDCQRAMGLAGFAPKDSGLSAFPPPKNAMK
jgi:hypothetical protein